MNIFQKTKAVILAHKLFSGAVIIVLAGSGFGIYRHYSSSSQAVKYVLSSAKKGTLVSSVSGSGQVAAENQVTIESEVAGDVTSVLANPGDEVKVGTPIAILDNRDAVKAVKNASLALENAKVAYEKAVRTAADQTPASASSDLAKAYQDGYNALANTSIDFPAIFDGLHDIIYDQSHSPYFGDIQIISRVNATAAEYKSEAGLSYDDAKREYDSIYTSLKNVSANSSHEDILSLLNSTDSVLKKLLAALTGTYNTIDYISQKLTGDIPPQIATDKSALSSYVSKVNADLDSIAKALTSIDGSRDSATTADLSKRSAELAVSQAEDSLADAQKALANHTIRAPFDGVIAKVDAKAGDKAAVGTAMAVIVTKKQIVNISLNELDAAKVAKGEKAKLAFDAIDGLSLAGHVSNVDLVGTVSQGVVTYTVEIAFDENDGRVKPGMTTNADIVTGEKENVLLVPTGAVKSQGSQSYVEVLGTGTSMDGKAIATTSSAAPRKVMVKTGDSNDSSVEIVSGLSEGDQVVVRTLSTATNNASAPSLLGNIGGKRNVGNAVMIQSK